MRRLGFSTAVGTLSLGALLLMTGCTSSSSLLPKYNQEFNAGNYQQASEMCVSKAKGDILWSLQKATADRLYGDYNLSNFMFDAAEAELKEQDEKILAGDVADYSIMLFGNAGWVDYRGETYEGVLLNTYKAMNYLSLNDRQNARIELNRALDRQRRAKEFFEKEIALQKQAIEEKQSEERANSSKKAQQGGPNLDNAGSDPRVQEIINDKYANIFEFEAYPDYVNPFTTYLAGLYFTLDGDARKGADLLKEAHGMLQNVDVVAQDFSMAEKKAGAITAFDQEPKYAWVVFENGLGPIKKEWRIDLPLFIVTNQVAYTGVALPKLEFRERALPHLFVNNGDQDFQSETIADMNRIVQTEFKKEFPMVLTNAIVSTAFKTYLQYYMKDRLGMVGLIAGGIYAAATTGADERIWSSMPRDFQVARVPINGSDITIKTPEGQELFRFTPEKRNTIVYLRMPTRQAKVHHEIITF